MMKRFFSFMAALLAGGLCAFAQPREYVCRQYEARNGQVLPYQILYPEHFDPSAKYPLVLFLHGSGERGTDGVAQLKHGGAFFAAAPELREAIFIAPQCPREDAWACYARPDNAAARPLYTWPYRAPVSSSLTAVKELLDAFVALGFADPDRLYACGLSLGAIGVLDLAMRYPDYFAAVEPICGAVHPQRCREFTGRTRFRFFHGTEDTAVYPKNSIEADAALKEAGAVSEIILYEGVPHQSWFNAFDEPDFLSWMLEKSL